MGYSLISSLSSMMSILSTASTLLLLALTGASSTQSCMSDGSTPPDCFHDPETPLYQPHQYDCSLFWQCTPDGRACLQECPAISEEQGGGRLFFNTDGKTVTETATGCQDLCDSYEECVAWTWNGDWRGSCFIKSKYSGKIFQLGAVSAKKVCL